MDNMTLYNLTDAYLQVLESLPEDVDQATVNDTLEAIQGAIEVKAFNIVAFTKELEGQADRIKAEEERLAKRRKALENRSKSLKTYLQARMELTGIGKIKTDLFTISLQNNPPSVQISEEKLIPSKFQIVIPATYQIDKKAIAEALKSGETVPGAALTQGRRLSIK